MSKPEPYRTERHALLITTCLNEDRVRSRRYNFSDEKLHNLMFEKKDVDMYFTYDQPIFRTAGKDVAGDPENKSDRTVFARRMIPIDDFVPKKKTSDPRVKQAFMESARQHEAQERARGVTHILETRSGRHISMEKGDTVYDLQNRQIWPAPKAPATAAKPKAPKR